MTLLQKQDISSMYSLWKPRAFKGIGIKKFVFKPWLRKLWLTWNSIYRQADLKLTESYLPLPPVC